MNIIKVLRLYKKYNYTTFYLFVLLWLILDVWIWHFYYKYLELYLFFNTFSIIFSYFIYSGSVDCALGLLIWR